MPFLNLNYGLIVYEDQTDRNPQIKLPDITRAVQGIQVDYDKSERIRLAPGAVADVAVTARAVAWDSSTQLVVDRYLAAGDNIRLRWTGTGTAPAFRTNRNIAGGADTVVNMTRVSPYVVRITNASGTAWSLGSVTNGDILKFEKNTDDVESPFNANLLGQTFMIQAKGSDYIDFVDNGAAPLDTAITLGADYAYILRAFSPGPVKVGDTLTVSGADINPSNQGTFEILDVSPDYVEINNPFAAEETFLYGSNMLTVYDYLIGLLHLRASGPVGIRYDGQTEWANKDRLGPEVLVLESCRAYRVQARNNDPTQDVTISVQHARVIG